MIENFFKMLGKFGKLHLFFRWVMKSVASKIIWMKIAKKSPDTVGNQASKRGSREKCGWESPRRCLFVRFETFWAERGRVGNHAPTCCVTVMMTVAGLQAPKSSLLQWLMASSCKLHLAHGASAARKHVKTAVWRCTGSRGFFVKPSGCSCACGCLGG